MIRAEKLGTSTPVEIKEYYSNLNRFMLRTHQKGSILIGLIITMVIMASLGAGMLYVTTTSIFQELFANNHTSAYYAAESGGRYAMSIIRKAFASTNYLTDLDYIALKNSSDAGASYTFGGHTFKVQNIVVSAVSGSTKQVEFDVTGIVNASSFLQAQRKLHYRIQPANQLGGVPPNPITPIYEPGMENFTDAPSGNAWGSISMDNTEGALKINSVNPGHGGALMGYSNTALAAAWASQGNKLSYMAQLKVKSTTTYFSAGLLFRVAATANNYQDMGLSFVQDHDDSYIPPGHSPIKDKPLIVLWSDQGGQHMSIQTQAYKILPDNNGVFSSTTYFSQDTFTSLGNWTTAAGGGTTNTNQWTLYTTDSHTAPNSASSGTCLKRRTSNPKIDGVNTLTLTTSINVTSGATLTFWHKGTFAHNSNLSGEVQIQKTSGGDWNTLKTYDEDEDDDIYRSYDWQQATFNIDGASPQFKVRFVLTNGGTSNATDTWFIDDVKIQSIPMLSDYSTLLVRIEEKVLTSADVTTGFSIGQRVADIRAYYGSQTSNGSACSSPTATDINRGGGNPRNQAEPCWPPCNPADTSCDSTTTTTTTTPPVTVVCSKDCFTLVLWNSPLPTGSNVTLLSDGYTLRTANSAFLTSSTSFPDTRAEFGVAAFGEDIGNKVYFDDFGVDFSCFSGSSGGGGTDGTGDIDVSP